MEERAEDGGGAGKVSERRNMPVTIAFLLPPLPPLHLLSVASCFIEGGGGRHVA